MAQTEEGRRPAVPLLERIKNNRRAIALSLIGLALFGAVTWLWGESVWRFLTDEAAIEALVLRAGVWGPLALILVNVVQIVIAPIPGYVVQFAAGYLYGPLWGGVFAAIGILLGSMAAMWVGRTFGRPAVRLMVGEMRLARWESVTHSNSPWLWFLLLVGPIGDLPYLLAGLSHVSYRTIFLITLLVRMPTAFLSTAIGGGALPVAWLGVLVAAAAVVMAVFYRYREPLLAWYERSVRHHSTPHPLVEVPDPLAPDRLHPELAAPEPVRPSSPRREI